ncbi:hypothetical protein VTN00DRAFT_5819 [Thermoascus crustaceus]|uniref:uncharacterized protein n=1 Tax=Thermoascus crustaceus TaxID=5088 RepID=UPI0037443698
MSPCAVDTSTVRHLQPDPPRARSRIGWSPSNPSRTPAANLPPYSEQHSGTLPNLLSSITFSFRRSGSVGWRIEARTVARPKQVGGSALRRFKYDARLRRHRNESFVALVGQSATSPYQP